MQKYKDFVVTIKSKLATEKLSELLKFGDEHKRNNSVEALKAFKKAKEIADSINDKDKYAEILFEISECLFKLEKHEESDETFDNTLEYILTNSLEQNRWFLCNKHALNYFKIGEYQKALIFFKRSLSIAEKLNDKEIKAGILNNIATMHSRQSEYFEAKEILKSCIKLQEEIGDHNGLLRSYNEIAIIYFKTNKMDKAMNSFLNALNNLKDNNEESAEMRSTILNNIANVYNDMDKLDEALDYYQQSLEIKKQLNDEYKIAITTSNIAVIYRKKQEFDKALEFFFESLEIVRKNKFKTYEARIYQNLGILYYDMKEPTVAINHLEKAVTIRRTLKDHYSLLCTFKNCINIHLEENNLEKAEKYIQEGLELSSKYNLHYLERDFWEMRISLYEKKKEIDNCNDSMKKFIELNKQLYKQEFSENLAKMQTRFQTELKEKEAEIYRLKTIELEQKNKQIEKQKIELENTLEDLRRSEISYTYATSELKNTLGLTIVGKSTQIKKIINLITKVAHTDKTSVLITGESGTGKELIARAIHDLSKRSQRNFCAVNVSSIPSSLFESEFFGYQKSAFTGADKDNPGWFEIADKGTLFLDEIGTLSSELQIKLLRVLEERKIIRLGSHQEIPVDIRIISATNSNLLQMVEKEDFRSDLYHRLATFVINIPPLRERINDIPLLLEYFVKHFGNKMNKQITRVERKVEIELMSYDFPGNVRELRNMVERAIIMCNSSTLKFSHFSMNAPAIKRSKNCDDIIPLEKLEKDMVLKALKSTGFHQAKAAKLLGIKPKAIERRMIKYGIKK